MVDRSPGFFDFDDRLAELSAKGDNLERVKAVVGFEMFRPALEAAVPRADRSKGGRPAFDHVETSEYRAVIGAGVSGWGRSAVICRS